MFRKRNIIIALIILIFTLYLTLFNMKPASVPTRNLIPFSKEGFIDSEELSETKKLVTSNADFELYINEVTSHIEVANKNTGEIWNSNPKRVDPWVFDSENHITNSAQDKQKSTLELSYYNSAGSTKTINNYKYSIYHPASLTDSAGKRTFSIKYFDDKVQILYFIEDLEVDYLFFPKYLPKDVLEGLEESDKLQKIAYKNFDEETQLYEIKQYDDMSKLVINEMYKVFYEELNYTRERSIEENAQYGYTEKFEKVYFEVAIEVALNDDGITTSIINNSIVEPENVKLSSITLFPLFGTAISTIDNEPSEGYIVLPDGSGAVIEFNNGKYYQEPYTKRLYGEDVALLSYKMQEQQQKISIPLFGMVKENSGFAAIITKGDAMATINADVSGRIDSYNKVYVSFALREVESVTLGSGFDQYGIDLWTKKIVKSDFTINYTFLDDAKNNYVGIAEVYRNYLINEKELTAKDNTNETVLTTEIIGAYDSQEFILGIPYTTVNSLTSFDQSLIIMDEFISRDITNINLLYTGMLDGGIRTDLSDNFKIEKTLGSKREFRNLLNELEEREITLYPRVKLTKTASYNKLFDKFRYTSNRVNGDLSRFFKYHLPSKLPYSETPYPSQKDDYVINPLFYTQIYKDFDNDYSGDALAFDMLGSLLAGSYEKNNSVYVTDALAIQEQLLSSIDEKVMISSPLGFAMPYSEVIIDLPTETTLYAILDYQIPLTHLVLSGYVDYSTTSINMDNERSLQYSFLKALESGSNVKYTLSYDDSKELRNTEYNYYISTQYSNWIDLIEDTIKEMDTLGIHNGYLIGHEVLSNNLVKVTYSHGLQLFINYNLNDVNYNDMLIPAMDYVVTEVN